jgi:hypothetical protein
MCLATGARQGANFHRVLRLQHSLCAGAGSQTGLESGLSQHPLGFFQGEFRMVGHYDRQQFGPYLSETKRLRFPAFTIRGIGAHAWRVGKAAEGAKRSTQAWLTRAPVRSTMFASCCHPRVRHDRLGLWLACGPSNREGDCHQSWLAQWPF